MMILSTVPLEIFDLLSKVFNSWTEWKFVSVREDMISQYFSVSFSQLSQKFAMFNALK